MPRWIIWNAALCAAYGDDTRETAGVSGTATTTASGTDPTGATLPTSDTGNEASAR